MSLMRRRSLTQGTPRAALSRLNRDNHLALLRAPERRVANATQEIIGELSDGTIIVAFNMLL
jgi:hypothetical protein